jgi:hypothetical protein
MADALQSVIHGPKKEVERLEKISARFEKSNSAHHARVQKLIHSIKKHIAMLQLPRKRRAKPKSH